MNPGGGPAIPVHVVTDSKVVGGPAIPVFGYYVAPTDGRPVSGQPARRVVLVSDSDLASGRYYLDGRPQALPVYADTSGRDEGNVAIPVYLVGGALSTPSAPALPKTFKASDFTALGTLSGLWYFGDKQYLWLGTALNGGNVAADGQSIASVNDLSGNNNYLKQTTSGNRPKYKVNQVNAISAALFDAVNDMLVPNSTLTLTGSFSVFSVIARSGATSGTLFDTDQFINGVIAYDATGLNNLTWLVTAGSGANVLMTVPTGTFNIVALTHHDAPSLSQGYANSTTPVFNLNDGSTFAGKGDLLFDIGSSFGGPVAIAGLYQPALSGPNLTALLQLLSSIYGLPLS